MFFNLMAIGLTTLASPQSLISINVATSNNNNSALNIRNFNHILLAQTTAPRTYYVSGNGSDSNSGLSTSTPFRNIQKAADLTNPGDTVYVMDGVYTNSSGWGSVVEITRSGTSSARIKYLAYPGSHPQLKFNGWNGINVLGASYIEINGFDIQGNNANITLDYALSEKSNLNNPLTSGNGIMINPRSSTEIRYPHHIRIANNQVHDCGGGGIGTINADYVDIHRNTTYNNGWYSPYANSGISLYQNRNYDNYDGYAYKMYVTNNISYGNRNYVPFLFVGTITDGNGIILDDSKNTQNNSTLGSYKGRTFIANNIVFNNGGSGIHTYMSEHADIVDNTAYLNSQSSETKGEIFANNSNDVRIYNNIAYALPKEPINPNYNNTDLSSDYNIYYNGSMVAPPAPHDLITDPQFVNPSTDPSVNNFHLKSTSPAINAGTWMLTASYDFDIKDRPSGSGYDIGAFEY